MTGKGVGQLGTDPGCPTARTEGRSWQRSLLIVVAIIVGVAVAAALFSRNSEERADRAAPESPTAAPGPTTTQAPTPVPAVPAEPAVTTDRSGLPDIERALAVASRPAPLGTYVVAKRDAGIARAAVPGESARREIPVYDQPFGPPRSLLDVNAVDSETRSIPLTNWDDPNGALVMRVIAGTPDDDWVIVQAPSRPHDSYVWVRSRDFDFGYTQQRIEIDLANVGLLQVFDGDQVILRSPIVQGRDSRPTPTHVTYLQRGIDGSRVSPAYGALILPIASFSETLGTFGGGGLPSNFIHGTNAPELMGQRVSSGGIRLPDEQLLALADIVTPGVPVLLFDSSGIRPTREVILNRQAVPATTADFLSATNQASDGTTGVAPEIWQRCELGGSRSELDADTAESKVDELEDTVGVPIAPSIDSPLLCRNDAGLEFVTAGSANEHVFAVAKPDAGEIYLAQDDIASNRPPNEVRRMIPVFDEPGGEPRALVYRNNIDNVTLDYPLYAVTVFDQPTVLSVIKISSDSQWLQVRAPVLPHDTSVWVRGEDFELQSTTLRVEVDVGYEFLGRVGIMNVWDDNVELMAAKISSGRESRPTVATSTYIDQIIVGGSVSPAYGPWIFSTPSYSEALGTFGGGGMPIQTIHGVGPPVDESLGMPASSGSIHISIEDAERMAQIEGLLGAPVYLFDSSAPSTSLHTVRGRAFARAETIPIALVDRQAPVGSFT